MVSTDGGTNFTPLCGKNTISENFGALGGLPALTGIRENWTREIVDLSTYAGSPSVLLRFQFTSNANNTADDYYRQEDDGFYVDNVRLMTSNAPMSVLPIQILKFEGKLLDAGKAELKWEATTDVQHDHYEIERSSDKNNFVSLGHAVEQMPYRFIDTSLQAGNNYYRLRQVGRDNRSTYSRIINIIYMPGKVSLVVYPNPVWEELKLQFSSATQKNYEILISDFLGRVVHSQKVHIRSGNVIINMRDKAPGSYVLLVKNSEQEVVANMKIIRHLH
jgi:hypothetical protein